MSEQNTLVDVQGRSSNADQHDQASRVPTSLDRSRSANEPSDQKAEFISLIFRDGLDMPIDGLTFIATYPSGFVCTAESTAVGAIALPIESAVQGSVKIEVKDSTGKTQPVCSVDLSKCEGAVIVRSPKTKAKVSFQPHQQVVPAKAASAPSRKVASQKKQDDQARTEPQKVDRSQGWWGANGSLEKAWAWLSSKHFFDGSAVQSAAAKSAAEGLSNAGQPVSALIGPEAPNSENLRLGRNDLYRQPILGASKRLGLIPQALCALMDCEAGKVSEKVPMLNPDGTPVKDKKGHPKVQTIRELWNANAGNAESGAAGLTQFLASTWLTHVLMPGYYIHEKSVANGWVKQVVDAKGKKRWMFVLADGSTSLQPYSKRGSDANVKKCLAMRMDPAWSINAAADYGNANLQVLATRGIKVAGLNDMDKAKLMYLMHHEGEGAGPLFIRNALSSAKGGTDGLRKKFEMQLGSAGRSRAAKLVEQADGDVEVAYRFWFADFVDKQFAQTSKYFFTAPLVASKLSALLVRVGGKEVESVD